MRLNIILVFLMGGFLCPVLSYASDTEDQGEREYVKLIEEGKTWEYIYSYRTWDWYTLTAFQMRFDDTETRNGIEYNKLIYCWDLTKWKADQHSDNYTCWWKDSAKEISSQPTDITTYFLMREENGKVYLYVKELLDSYIEKLNDYGYVYDVDHYLMNHLKDIKDQGDETIIYDFTKKTGETINNVLCNIMPVANDIYPFIDAWWAIMDLSVESTSTIDANGIQLVFQNLNSPIRESILCIEGVGAVKSGFLPCIDSSDFVTGMKYSAYYLNCLTYADGEIIYKANEDQYIDVAKIIEMADMEAPNVTPFIERNGCEINAENAVITLYDLSGRVMDSGFETLSTASLQPGVYVAKAQSPTGISTLKLKVD